MLFQKKVVTWRKIENQAQKEKSTFTDNWWECQSTETSCNKREKEWKDSKMKVTWMRRWVHFGWSGLQNGLNCSALNQWVSEVYKVMKHNCLQQFAGNKLYLCSVVDVFRMVKAGAGGSSGSSLPIKSHEHKHSHSSWRKGQGWILGCIQFAKILVNRDRTG